jgi:uncharacterized damage-inducible protein DinB
MVDEKALRVQLATFLDWKQAHATFDDVVKGIPPRLRGAVPTGFAHSVWQIVEHIRLAQADILAFSVSKEYREKKWPDDYWPKALAPKNAAAWNASLKAFRRDRKAMQRLAANRRIDLLANVPHGTGQTYLREILLVADHTAHHVAQIIDIRRALGIWGSRTGI